MAKRADEIGMDILLGNRGYRTSGHGNVRWGGYRPPTVGGILPTVVTKQDARATLDRARNFISALGNEIKVSGAPADFKAKWISFEFSWIAYYSAASNEVDSSIIGVNALSIIEKTEEFEKRAKEYQSKFNELLKASGKPTSNVEAPPEPPKGPDLPAFGGGIGVGLAIAALGIGVLVIKR